jgi:four helix bundle protein
MNKYDLEDRLIHFAVDAIRIIRTIPGSIEGKHLSGQLVRSASSSALNYGEAQSAESIRDFIHKMKVVLKELRESLVCLKIIYFSGLMNETKPITDMMSECNELISIFVKSIQTAQRNLDQKGKTQSNKTETASSK